jgi:DNA-binding PadR family transcriptional regulator
MHHDHTCGGAMPWPPFFASGGRGFRPPHGFPPHPPGTPPWFKHIFGGGPPRAERGEVRYLILDALRDQPRHGYEVIQAIESRTEGAYRPSPGTVYPTLQMLEELDLVRSSEEDGRKVYSITDEGRAELEAHQDEVEDAYERFCEGPFAVDPREFSEMWERLHQMFRSIGKALRRGRISATKRKAIKRAVSEAAERIEEILRQ